MDIDFDKEGGLVPVIVQDATTLKVLMLAYMNEEALSLTRKTKKLTFYSRSRKELWVKGETSGNYLNLVDIKVDCDGDTLLARAIPDGPACHTGSDTCWDEVNKKDSL
ncbi:MAG: phosphoribosyl-AMP cyclohydrolase, partial [Bacteroidota bacterium]